MQVSIIIPVFNEAASIRPFLSNLRERTRGAEIIVVDGGSNDGTDRLTDGFAHYAGLVLRMRCGDHGIFCRRKAFVDAGGFPDVPVMEDVEFFRRLRRCGRVVYSNKRIAASPRRYETVGPARLTFAFGSIATLYLFGVSLSTLAHIYRRTCCGQHEQPILLK